MKIQAIIYIVIAVFVVVLVGSTIYFLDQNQKRERANARTQISITPIPTKQAVPTATPTASQSSQISEPVVIIEAELTLPKGDKEGLRKKVIEPYIDYFKDAHKDDFLVSFKVSVNTGSSNSQYPYKADSISKNGVNEGFLISKTAGSIDWWYPECLAKCEFSDTFRARYPEIVAKVE